MRVPKGLTALVIVCLAMTTWSCVKTNTDRLKSSRVYGGGGYRTAVICFDGCKLVKHDGTELKRSVHVFWGQPLIWCNHSNNTVLVKVESPFAFDGRTAFRLRAGQSARASVAWGLPAGKMTKFEFVCVSEETGKSEGSGVGALESDGPPKDDPKDDPGGSGGT